MIPILIAQSELLDRPQTIYWHNAFDWRQGLNMPSMLEEFELWWVAVSIKLGLRTFRLYSLESWGPMSIECGPPGHGSAFDGAVAVGRRFRWQPWAAMRHEQAGAGRC